MLELIPGHEAAVAEGKADIGITYLPVPHAELDVLKVTTVEMGVFGASKWLDKAFDELPFVIPVAPVSGTPSKVQGLDGWPDHLRHRNIVFRVALLETALNLCRQGLAVGFSKF